MPKPLLLFVLLLSGCEEFIKNHLNNSVCGDGRVDEAEECDDGNLIDEDACLSTCQLSPCGDGVLNADEECDDGEGNSNTKPDACRIDCTNPICGDGVVDPVLGEACERPGVGGCGSDCQLLGSCGDGVVDAGEVCDDQNQDSTDDCINCQGAFCGDGFIETGAEQCDDGNSLDDDGCDDDCLPTIAQIEAGGDHTCVRSRSGEVICWGDNFFGQLGYGNTNTIGDNESPSSGGVVDLEFNELKEISLGTSHSCALSIDGGLRCWGDNLFGQLGYQSTDSVGDDEVPADFAPVNVGAEVKKIFAGGFHTCAILGNDAVKCWGDDTFGQLGYGFDAGGLLPSQLAEVQIPNGGSPVVQLALGDSHTCALLGNGGVLCWGSNERGQLGDPLSGPGRDFPGEVPNVSGAQEIAAGNFHNCVRSNNNLICWGEGGDGQLGYGPLNSLQPNDGDPSNDAIGDDEPPFSETLNIGVGALGSSPSLALGGVEEVGFDEDGHSCVITNQKRVRCWGTASSGQLGYGNINLIGDDKTPAADYSLGLSDIQLGDIQIRQITAGAFHTCALAQTGEIQCWGKNNLGQIGHPGLSSLGDTQTPNSAGFIDLF